jgi:outer membrane protein TolC
MKPAGLIVIGGAAALAACTHYAAAPPRPDALAVAYDARRLDEKPPGAAWTGADLLAAALARNPQVAEARARRLVALAAIRTARQLPAATLTLTGEYANEHPHWGYGAAGEFPLDVGARRSTRITTAELQALQAFYDYGEAAWMVRMALERARIDLTAAQAQIEAADRALELRRERAARIDRRVAAGEDDRFLSLPAQAEVAAAERRAAEARSRSAQAAAALAKALGVSADAVRGLKLSGTAGSPALSDLPSWRRDAALSRRDVLRAIADYDLAENALRAEVAKQYPEIRLGPGYMYDHGVNKLPFNLVLALPPYDLNRSGIAQAEASRLAAGRSLEATQAGVLAAVDAAEAALTAARGALDQAQGGALAAARRTTADTAAAVRAGTADRVDDLGARAAEAEAELAVLDAERAVRVAVADLEDALRRAFDPAETAILAQALVTPGAPR